MSKSSPIRMTRGDAVFAQDRTSKQLLFANLKQPAFALGLLCQAELVKIDLSMASAVPC
jgi:hypothetical protein